MSSILSSELLKESVEQCFGNLPDTRVPGKTAHKLIDIITISLLAVICGADGWVGIETYGKAKQTWLESFLQLSNGVPSYDTFARVIARLNSEILEKNFQGSLLCRQSVAGTAHPRHRLRSRLATPCVAYLSLRLCGKTDNSKARVRGSSHR